MLRSPASTTRTEPSPRLVASTPVKFGPVFAPCWSPQGTRGGEEKEQRERKEVSTHCLREVRSREPVGDKGSRGSGREGRRVTDNHPLSARPPRRPQNPKGPVWLQDTLQQPCTGFKLKSENLPLTVRTCFLGGLAAEGREGESCSRRAAKTLDSVTSLQDQKGNTPGS